MAAIINLISTLLRLLEEGLKRRRERLEAQEVQARHDAHMAERDKLDADPVGWYRGHFSRPPSELRSDVPADKEGDDPVQAVPRDR